MKFKLYGTITFNKNIEEAESDINQFINKANKEILLKGLGNNDESEGAHIKEWNIEDSELKLVIVSGHKIRAHDGLLRLKKPLGELLGKKYHLGIRKIYADEYKITIPRDTNEYDIDIKAAEKIPQINNINIKDNEINFIIKDFDESSLRKQSINRIIKQIANKKDDKKLDEEENELDLTYHLNSTPGEIVEESSEFKTYFKGDVTEKLAELGWIKKFPGKGQWFYGPQITALQRAFEKVIDEKIIDKLEFQECLFPKLIPLETMEKMKYLEGLPEGMYYTSAPKRDPELFKQFKNDLIINKEIPMKLLEEGLKSPSNVLAAAQCEPFYEFLAHEVIDEKELPIKYYDKSGWTYRWEGGGSKGLDRVNEFQRTELVWLAEPEEAEKIRDTTLKLSHELISELELEWYTEVGDDPFYLEGRKVESRGIEFPDTPKYEMRIKVPGQEKGVAIVSANLHGTHFIEGFSIKESHKKKLWTGCTGFGLTRLLFGFLSQKGFDKKNWPKLIRDNIKDTKVPKILTWP
ncbi:MAG: serine--tRNA ligase [Methanobacteriaceae archaeon]|jgi:seryl-tRNA synthetase|nr:serine--tRNA ligase [Methanobacteriaceae archaeon]